MDRGRSKGTNPASGGMVHGATVGGKIKDLLNVPYPKHEPPSTQNSGKPGTKLF